MWKTLRIGALDINGNSHDTIMMMNDDAEWILSNSSDRELILLAWITRKVSSANLQKKLLPGVTGMRSPALTTHNTGPTFEPWMMLADIQWGKDLTLEVSTVRMTRKVIDQPVVDTIWDSLPASEEEFRDGPYQMLCWNRVKWQPRTDHQ